MIDNCAMKGGFPRGWRGEKNSPPHHSVSLSFAVGLSDEVEKRCHRWQRDFSFSSKEAESSQRCWSCLHHGFFVLLTKETDKLMCVSSHGALICFLLSVCPCPSELRDVSGFGQRTWEMLPRDIWAQLTCKQHRQQKYIVDSGRKIVAIKSDNLAF